MAGVKSIVGKLRAKFGELWWWSLIIFISCRFGDLINAFIGLWLVPKYIPQEELGAALPILQAANIFGLPLAILVTPFSRWLTIYATRGEKGKIKRLLQIVCYGALGAFVAAVIVSHFMLPHLFERLKVAKGSLGMLIVCAGLAGPVSTVFNNALQGLKRFKAMSVINMLGAPLRLAVMLVAMPFRALSGYVAGQIATPMLITFAGWFAIRKDLGKKVQSVALGRDVIDMGRFLAPFALYLTVGTIIGSWQALLFRQRLPEIESAAFYIISRLAEVATFAGASIVWVAFPMAVEAKMKGGEKSLLVKLLLGTLAPGLLITVFLAIFGRMVLNVLPLWRDYVPYAALLAAYTLRMTVVSATGAFYSYETAAGRFKFLRYWMPLTVVETGVLICLTGYGAFEGILPAGMVEWMKNLNASNLAFFVWWLLACSLAQALAIGIHLKIRWRREKN